MKECVIIATRNRPSLLENCIKALTKQTKIPRQIVVVSSSVSAEYTQETRIIQRLIRQLPIDYYHVQHKNKSFSLNYAIRQTNSDTDLCLFTDDDCVVGDFWVETMIAMHKKHSEMIIGGVYDTQKTSLVSSWVYNEPQYKHPRIFEDKNFFVGGNVGIKRKFFSSPNAWFNEQYSVCEDTELRYRATQNYNAQVLLINYKQMIVKHYFRKSSIDALRAHFWYGFGDFFIFEKFDPHYKYLYTPGRKMRFFRFLVHYPFALYNSVSSFYKDKRSVILTLIHTLLFSVKLLGIGFGLFVYLYRGAKAPHALSIAHYFLYSKHNDNTKTCLR